MENRKKNVTYSRHISNPDKFGFFLIFILFTIWILIVFTDVNPNDFKAMNPTVIVKSEQRMIIRT